MARLNYTYDELMEDGPYASRIRWGEKLFHGGLDADGAYVPPRSTHRIAAIRAWTGELVKQGLPAEVIQFEQLDLRFFPNVEQTRLLLRNGARGAMTRILTLIGITEGFGNDGLRLFPQPPLKPFFRESIENTCLDHLYHGLFEAHGNDEAGRGAECGHNEMWYSIRDASLDHPVITPDMFENLPIAPPPGYEGPGKPAPEAIGVGQMTLSFPTLDPRFELLVTVMTQLLVIELLAYGTFAWAKEVLSDPDCSAEPELAPRWVDYIQQDETIHVDYLQCALAEIRCRTLLGNDGVEIPGKEFIDAICERTLDGSRQAGRRERLLRYRMRQIEEELSARPDGQSLLAEFARLGPVPE